MDTTFVAAAVAAATASISAGALGGRLSGVLGVIERVHAGRRTQYLEVVREQRRLAEGALTRLPCGATLTHTASGSCLTICTASVSGRAHSTEGPGA